jgi:CheY-like chemotaxis protein
VSLLGRLEDLSLADIIQIVYLSRRTGTLEIHDARGEHALAFRNGVLVDATSAEVADVRSWLASRGIDLDGEGTDVVAEAVRARMVEVVAPLLQSSEGEFRFVLAEDSAPMKLDYDPHVLFREGGLTPQRVLAAADRPLRGLEDTLKAGKALIRTAQENAVAFPSAPAARPSPPPPPPAPADASFRVAGGLIAVESPEARMRNVVLFERDAMIRVAAKRAFARRDITISQFSAVDDARRAISDWFRTHSFFVTVLEVAEGSPALLRDIKRKNVHLPVAMIDTSDDQQERQEMLRAGADLYLSKPASADEAQLNRFADDLVEFARGSFDQWEKLVGSWGADAGRRFYEQAERERADRTFDVLKEFIAELSNPNDVAEIGATILRLANDYLDRAALFVVRSDYFVTAGDGAKIRIDRHQPSVLSDVAASGVAHRGKMRRTPANEQLIAALGGDLPTEVVALPIVHSGRTLGILYGDNAKNRAPIEPLTGLEVFLVQAAFAFGSAVEASEFAGQ